MPNKKNINDNSRWQRLATHWRNGTLGSTLVKRIRRTEAYQSIRWNGADTPQKAAWYLAERAKTAIRLAPNTRALIVGDNTDTHKLLVQRLTNTNIPFEILNLKDTLDLASEQIQDASIVLCSFQDARRQTRIAQMLAQHPMLSELPFEYVAGLDRSNDAMHRLDEYAETHFVSPVLLDQPNPYEIYEESLHFFEQKCGLRDFLDLYQLLKNLVINEIPGDIAEFGSYRGHSGWLIARTLEVLGSQKKLFMFDTFESFPVEVYGVDHFWSDTHLVDFEEVSSKFKNFNNVTLVRGDFTATLDETPIQELALGYIDCDSYRATSFLLERLPARYLAKQGILVCEDYGHPALLGNRAAVHDAFDGIPGWFQYFSQFSGLYVMVKL